MSDDRLRQLLRRFRETGAVGDEVAWIQEMLRVGVFDAGRLEYLALLGYPAAGQVLGREPLPLREWASYPAPVSARARVALALATGLSDEGFLSGERKLRQEMWDGYYDDLRTIRLDESEQPLMLRAQARVVELLERRVLEDATAQSWGADDGSRGAGLLKRLAQKAVGWLSGVNRVTLRPMTSQGGDGVLTSRLLGFLRDPEQGFVPLVKLALEHFYGTDTFRERICTQVVPWVLGYGDPVLERAGGD